METTEESTSSQVTEQRCATTSHSEVLTRKKKRELCETTSGGSSVHRNQLEWLRDVEDQEQERRDELFERWLHSPERTKKWRRKLAKMDKADAASQQGAFSDIWVQCEKPDCLKWRRLSREQGEALQESAPWFCSLNPNMSHRNCNQPQEDFMCMERQAHRLGVKYIASCFPEGTVVWAKMPGFRRWPGMVTVDHAYGSHVYQDADDEPLSYHVEYLGEQHTHGWLGASWVTLYGKVDEIQQLQAATTPVRSVIGKSRKMKISQKKSNEKGAKTSFRKNGVKCTLEAAIEEADRLLDLPVSDRLGKIVYDPSSFQAACGKPTTQATDETKTTALPSLPKSTMKGTKNAKLVPRRKHEVSTSAARQVAAVSPQPSVTGFEAVKRQLRRQTAMAACHNKQEKFAIDVLMYKKNEKAFEHDVRRFMIRHCRPIVKLPHWGGIPVNLFQLFLAIYDRGGYENVVKNRLFEQIYREMTGAVGTSRGSTAKKYYERNLLPYELYINKQDYEHCFDKTQQQQVKPRVKQTAIKEITVKGKREAPPAAVSMGTTADTLHQVPSVSHASFDDDETLGGLAETELREIDNILSQLDSFSTGFYSTTEHSIYGGDKLVVGEGYFPPEADTASQRGLPAVPVEEAQIVPEVEEEYDYVEL